MSYIKFGSKEHTENLLYTLEHAIAQNIGRKWDASQWDLVHRTCGMIEAVLCVYLPNKFAPGRKFEFQTITTSYKTFFGNIRSKVRRESYAEMLLRNLKDYNSTL